MKTALGYGIDMWVPTCCVVRGLQGSCCWMLWGCLALRPPIREVMTIPLPQCPLSCCRRRGKTRDRIFASATSGAVKEEVQRDVRLHPGEHFINPKPVISFLFTTFKKHGFYCKVQQDSLNFGLTSLMLMSSLGHALNTCL